MRRLGVLVALSLAIPGVTSCSSSSVASSDDDRRDVKRWLVCSDCTDGELDRVLALAGGAERFLRVAIAEGPGRADDSVVVELAEETVVRARRYRSDRGQVQVLTTADSSAVVSRQLDEFRLRYRLRAMQALRRIDARADSIAVRRLCANPPTELVNLPEFRAQFAVFGICP